MHKQPGVSGTAQPSPTSAGNAAHAGGSVQRDQSQLQAVAQGSAQPALPACHGFSAQDSDEALKPAASNGAAAEDPRPQQQSQAQTTGEPGIADPDDPPRSEKSNWPLVTDAPRSRRLSNRLHGIPAERQPLPMSGHNKPRKGKRKSASAGEIDMGMGDVPDASGPADQAGSGKSEGLQQASADQGEAGVLEHGPSKGKKARRASSSDSLKDKGKKKRSMARSQQEAALAEKPSTTDAVGSIQQEVQVPGSPLRTRSGAAFRPGASQLHQSDDQQAAPAEASISECDQQTMQVKASHVSVPPASASRNADERSEPSPTHQQDDQQPSPDEPGTADSIQQVEQAQNEASPAFPVGNTPDTIRVTDKHLGSVHDEPSPPTDAHDEIEQQEMQAQDDRASLSPLKTRSGKNSGIKRLKRTDAPKPVPCETSANDGKHGEEHAQPDKTLPSPEERPSGDVEAPCQDTPQRLDTALADAATDQQQPEKQAEASNAPAQAPKTSSAALTGQVSLAEASSAVQPGKAAEVQAGRKKGKKKHRLSGSARQAPSKICSGGVKKRGGRPRKPRPCIQEAALQTDLTTQHAGGASDCIQPEERLADASALDTLPPQEQPLRLETPALSSGRMPQQPDEPIHNKHVQQVEHDLRSSRSRHATDTSDAMLEQDNAEVASRPAGLPVTEQPEHSLDEAVPRTLRSDTQWRIALDTPPAKRLRSSRLSTEDLNVASAVPSYSRGSISAEVASLHGDIIPDTGRKARKSSRSHRNERLAHEQPAGSGSSAGQADSVRRSQRSGSSAGHSRLAKSAERHDQAGSAGHEDRPLHASRSKLGLSGSLLAGSVDPVPATGGAPQMGSAADDEVSSPPENPVASDGKLPRSDTDRDMLLNGSSKHEEAPPQASAEGDVSGPAAAVQFEMNAIECTAEASHEQHPDEQNPDLQAMQDLDAMAEACKPGDAPPEPAAPVSRQVEGIPQMPSDCSSMEVAAGEHEEARAAGNQLEQQMQVDDTRTLADSAQAGEDAAQPVLPASEAIAADPDPMSTSDCAQEAQRQPCASMSPPTQPSDEGDKSAQGNEAEADDVSKRSEEPEAAQHGILAADKSSTADHPNAVTNEAADEAKAADLAHQSSHPMQHSGDSMSVANASGTMAKALDPLFFHPSRLDIAAQSVSSQSDEDMAAESNSVPESDSELADALEDDLLAVNDEPCPKKRRRLKADDDRGDDKRLCDTHSHAEKPEQIGNAELTDQQQQLDIHGDHVMAAVNSSKANETCAREHDERNLEGRPAQVVLEYLSPMQLEHAAEPDLRHHVPLEDNIHADRRSAEKPHTDLAQERHAAVQDGVAGTSMSPDSQLRRLLQRVGYEKLRKMLLDGIPNLAASGQDHGQQSQGSQPSVAANTAAAAAAAPSVGPTLADKAGDRPGAGSVSQSAQRPAPCVLPTSAAAAAFPTELDVPGLHRRAPAGVSPETERAADPHSCAQGTARQQADRGMPLGAAHDVGGHMKTRHDPPGGSFAPAGHEEDSSRQVQGEAAIMPDASSQQITPSPTQMQPHLHRWQLGEESQQGRLTPLGIPQRNAASRFENFRVPSARRFRQSMTSNAIQVRQLSIGISVSVLCSCT